MIENLKDIETLGMAKFLAHQEKKWKCPECGGVICCHDGMCYTCGQSDLTNRKKKQDWTNNI